MKIYKYDEETKERTTTTGAMIDPLESKLKKEDVFLIPANATDKPPPDVKDNEVACFDIESGEWVTRLDYRGFTGHTMNGGRFIIKDLDVPKPPNVGEFELACFDTELGIWTIEVDLRSKKYFLTESGAPYKITEIGSLPDNTLTEIEPPDDVSKWDTDTEDWVKDIEKEKEKNKKETENQLKSNEHKLLLVLEDLLEIPSIKEQLSEESLLVLNERKALKDKLKK